VNRTRCRGALRGWPVVLGLLFLSPAAAGRAQTDDPPGPSEDVPRFSSFLSLPTAPEVGRRFDAARDYLQDRAWAEAMRVLQGVLDDPEDAFMPRPAPRRGSGPAFRWVSVRAEANRLIASAPDKGVEHYETAYGPQARALLARAQAGNDRRLLGRVVQRYLHTRAGAEAAARLAGYHLDRGQARLAARYFEEALASAANRKPEPRTLFLAALAFRSSGDRAGADRTWARLTALAPRGVLLGDRTVPLAELAQQLADPLSPAPPSAADDWRLFGGDAHRTASAPRPPEFAGKPDGPGGALVLTAAWQHATAHEDVTRDWLASAARQQEALGQTALPAFAPVTAAGKVIFRSHRGVEAVDRRTGARSWESASDWGLDGLAAEPRHRAHAGAWVDACLPAHPNLLIDNSVLGSLSTDGARVYAVEDLAVPPWPRSYAGFAGRRGHGLELSLAPEMTAAVYHNRLLAIDVMSGKVVWERGGPESAAPARPSLLRGSFFLGPPLPLAGQLYALVERDEELYLVCQAAEDGRLEWSQKVATPRNPLVVDGGRRQHAAPLASADGLLVCPTNAGGLVAFDLITHRLAWAHAYRAEPPPPPPPPPGRRRWRVTLATEPPNLTPAWQQAGPVIADGKVVLTSPDEPSLECLSLRDGRSLWKAARKDGDLFLAGVFGGKVLVVGRQECRALRLADGATAWEREVGQPSGRGVAAAGLYYLPLQAPAREEAPQICALDIDRGTVRARLAPPPGGAPGNLVFCGGMVLSQTAQALTAYPQRSAPGEP
jgi:outer membrane protein assembly factor BamB